MDSGAFPASAANGAQDGNANKIARTNTITGIVWSPGTDLICRWQRIGGNHGAGIDDVSFAAARCRPQPPTNIVWSGATSGDWDNLTANWLLSGTPGTYMSGDYVQFDDAASGVKTITWPPPSFPGASPSRTTRRGTR